MSKETKKKKTVKATPAFDLRAHILGYDDTEVSEVKIEEWGGVTIYMKPWTAKDRDDFDIYRLRKPEEGSEKEDEEICIRAAMLAFSAYSDKECTQKVFQPEDIPALALKSAGAVEKCLNTIKGVNRISDEDEKELLKK